MWLCPYCGCENQNDDRIGMQEPKCRVCKADRISAEDLILKKEKEIADFKTDLKEVVDRMQSIRENIDYHTTELSAAKERWEEHNRDKKYLIDEIKKWQQIKVIREPISKEIKIKNDKHQKTVVEFLK